MAFWNQPSTETWLYREYFIVQTTCTSHTEIYTILKEENVKDIGGIFHCFSGTIKEAKKIIDLGFLLGIGGVITFKNSNLSHIIKDIPIENIVLETDAPYLAPHPMRGHRNEPKYLSIIAKKIATIKSIDIHKIAKITSNNIDNLFFNRNQNII